MITFYMIKSCSVSAFSITFFFGHLAVLAGKVGKVSLVFRIGSEFPPFSQYTFLHPVVLA